MRAVEKWFDPFVAEVRQREAGSPVQSVAELVWIACELEYTDDAGQAAKVRDHVKPGVLEGYLRGRAKHQGIVLLEHRPMADVRGVQAEAMAILGNLGRIPTEATFGGDDNHITISLTGTVTAEAKVGAVKFEGEASPGGVSGKASVKGNVGELEAHGSGEGVGASLKTPGGTKVGVDIGKGAKAELKAGDFVTVKGSVQPEGDGRVSWSAQITIGTLGDVITPADVAKVMNGAQETFSKSGAALMQDRGLEGLVEHGGPLKSAVTDVAAKARKSAGQGKPGWSVGVGVKGDKTGGYSGTVDAHLGLLTRATRPQAGQLMPARAASSSLRSAPISSSWSVPTLSIENPFPAYRRAVSPERVCMPAPIPLAWQARRMRSTASTCRGSSPEPASGIPSASARSAGPT